MKPELLTSSFLHVFILFWAEYELVCHTTLSIIYLDPVYAIEYAFKISSSTCLNSLAVAFPAEI